MNAETKAVMCRDEERANKKRVIIIERKVKVGWRL